MKKLLYRPGVALIAALLAIALAPCFAFADTPSATPEPTAPVPVDATADDYDDYDYEYDPDKPWLYYEMTEEEYYEEFEPWRLTGQTEEEYWDEYWQNQQKEWRASTLSSFGFTETDITNIAVNGKALNFEGAKPVVRNGVTMIPARAVFEALGADVSYDGKTKTVTIAANGVSVSLTAGSPTVPIEEDGQSPEYSHTSELIEAKIPFIDNATFYVPLRQAAESLGFDVYWDNYYKVAAIIDKDGLIAEIDAQFTVLNALIQSEFDKFVAGLSSNETERTDVNFTAALSARYDPDYYYDDEYTDSTESGAKAEGTIKMLSNGNGIDVTGDASLEIDGFEELLGEIDKDPELKAVFDDLKKGVPFDFILNYTDAAMYLHLPILSHIDPRFDRNTWLSSLAEDYDLYSDIQMMAEIMEEGLEDGDITLGNLLYMVFFDYDYTYTPDFDKVDSLRRSARVLAPFIGDAYMEKNGDTYTISLNRLELFNVFRKLSNEEDMYIPGIYDYAEFLAGIPVANYKLEIKEKDGAPVSTELVVNVKVKTDEYYSDSGSIEFHYNLTADSEARKATVDYSIAAEYLGPIESGEISIHADAASAPTDETPRTEPPARAKVISIEDL
jgi:hypothetical protein